VQNWIVAGLIVVGTWLVTRINGLLLKWFVRHLANRALSAGGGPWRVRSGRMQEDSTTIREQRRRQRVDAASKMVNHLVSLVMWIISLIVVFHVIDVDAAFYLSSAGFLGAAVAIGGQHKVNDYLTGLLVHLEDRYGVGDTIEWESPVGNQLSGLVEYVGIFTTRVREGNGSMHVPNSQLNMLRNTSQEPVVTTLRIRVNDKPSVGQVESTLRELAGSPGLTEVLFVDDIASYQEATGEISIDVATSRPLEAKERDRLVRRAEQALRND
jgi:small-conductance mechanosensitive channel